MHLAGLLLAYLICILVIYFVGRNKGGDVLAIYNYNYYLLSFVLLLFLFVGLKAYFICEQGPDIGSEIIAPTFLTDTGKEAFRHLGLAQADDPDLCVAQKICYSTRQADNSDHFILSNELITHFSSDSDMIDWVKGAQLSLSEETLYRGRYLHHYSTIVEPFRQLRSGDLVAAVTSQYGVASLIPLYFFNGTQFPFYGALSLSLIPIIFLILGIVAWKRGNFRSSVSLYALMLFPLVFIINQGAIKISPGFAIYRLVPLFLMILTFLYRDRVSVIVSAGIVTILAVFNAVQFNILFILMLCAHFGMRFLVSRSRFQEIKTWGGWQYLLLVVGVSLVQFWLYQDSKDAFTPTLFGSVGSGEFHWTYFVYAAFFPFSVLLSHLVVQKKLVLDDRELFSFIAYGFVVTYPVSFFGSPEHYAGFFMMASPAIFTLLRSAAAQGRVWLAFAFVALTIPPYHYQFFSWPQKGLSDTSNYYVSNEFGHILKYSSFDDVGKLYEQYVNLQKSVGATDENTYFISKDKIYFEALTGKNMLPESYDAYVNVVSATPNKISKSLRKGNIKYVILDSPAFSRNFLKFLDASGLKYTGEIEQAGYKSIFSHIEEIREMRNLKEFRCSQRYCVYKVIQ